MLTQPYPEAPAPARTNTAAVAILYEPEGELLSRLLRVQAQVARLFVVSNDNGPVERLAGLDSERFEYLQNGNKGGLAAALNAGLRCCAEQGFAWCVLLDQDTVVDPDFLSGLAEAYASYPEPGKIGVLVPNYRSPGGNRLAYRADVSWQHVATAVTSGSLVPLTVVKRVGGMHEAFFIEGIDVEFGLRVRAAGMHLVATGRPLMTHGAGATEERRLFGRTVLVGNHPPWRCFLQYQNLTWILLRHGRVDLKWTGSSLLAMVKRAVLVLLFERQAGAKLWAMLRGGFAGLRMALRSDKSHTPSAT